MKKYLLIFVMILIYFPNAGVYGQFILISGNAPIQVDQSNIPDDVKERRREVSFQNEDILKSFTSDYESMNKQYETMKEIIEPVLWQQGAILLNEKKYKDASECFSTLAETESGYEYAKIASAFALACERLEVCGGVIVSETNNNNLHIGDIIYSIDGQIINNLEEFIQYHGIENAAHQIEVLRLEENQWKKYIFILSNSEHVVLHGLNVSKDKIVDELYMDQNDIEEQIRKISSELETIGLQLTEEIKESDIILN